MSVWLILTFYIKFLTSYCSLVLFCLFLFHQYLFFSFPALFINGSGSATVSLPPKSSKNLVLSIKQKKTSKVLCQTLHWQLQKYQIWREHKCEKEFQRRPIWLFASEVSLCCIVFLIFGCCFVDFFPIG